MRAAVRGGLAAALLAAALPATAEAPPGASSCSGCHAPAGSPPTAIPRLDGRTAAEIAAAMAEFRSGRRAATVMDRIAKGFTEAETEAIAAWIAPPR